MTGTPPRLVKHAGRPSLGAARTLAARGRQAGELGGERVGLGGVRAELVQKARDEAVFARLLRGPQPPLLERVEPAERPSARDLAVRREILELARPLVLVAPEHGEQAVVRVPRGAVLLELHLGVDVGLHQVGEGLLLVVQVKGQRDLREHVAAGDPRAADDHGPVRREALLRGDDRLERARLAGRRPADDEHQITRHTARVAELERAVGDAADAEEGDPPDLHAAPKRYARAAGRVVEIF